MSRVLVTGGCGFIGCNLLPMLMKRSKSVCILDNLTTGRRENVEHLGLELIVGDICDPKAVAHAMEGVDEVIHLAAHTSVVDSIRDPQRDFHSNALGTLTLLLAAAKSGIKRFIMASTGGAILGEKCPPVNEKMVPQPLSPYGASKLAGEAYCSAFYGSYGLHTVALRFSNVYGPHSNEKASIVATFYKRLLQGQPLVIYGDGNQTRDFLFAEDLVEAICLALEKAPGGDVFHIASGCETSINDLVAEMRDVVRDVPFDVNYMPRRPGEVIRNFSDISKARNVLGYSPQTSLRAGLQVTWRWFKQNEKLIFHS